MFLHSHADNNQQLCVIQYYFVIVGFSGDPRRDLPGLYLYMMKLLFHPHNSVGFMRVFAFSHKLCPRSRVIDCMADDVDYITVFVVPNWEPSRPAHHMLCRRVVDKEQGLWLWCQSQFTAGGWWMWWQEGVSKGCRVCRLCQQGIQHMTGFSLVRMEWKTLSCSSLLYGVSSNVSWLLEHISDWNSGQVWCIRIGILELFGSFHQPPQVFKLWHFYSRSLKSSMPFDK